MARARRAAVPAPGGPYGFLEHIHYVRFCLCRPIEPHVRSGFGTSTGVDVRPEDVRPVDVRYGVVWFCLCRPIEPHVRSGFGTSSGVRVRGVRFAWRSFPNGLYQKKAKIDFGVS